MSKLDYTTLAGYLAWVGDPRDGRGRRYEWLYLLVLIAAAMMTGERTLVGISRWVEAHQAELIAALQPRCRRTPSLATLRRALCRVQVEQLEAAIGAYQVALECETGGAGTIVTQQGEVLRGQALDGKTVRCASAYGRVVHLVSVVDHESGLVLDQAQVAVKLNERRIAEQMLARQVAQQRLTGTVTTMDALHTTAKQARQIVQGGGHYLLVVKRNQRALYDDIAAVFAELPRCNHHEQALWQYAVTTTSEQRGHGRREHYVLESTTALNGYITFPAVAQVLRRTRISRRRASGGKLAGQWVTSRTAEFLITSLSPAQVTLEQLACLRRWHWTIENITHYPRDVSFGEDHCQVRAAQAPQALAALRNAVAATLRINGWPYLPNGFRYCRTNLHKNLQLFGALAT
jgi:predicted transposase YbfD/YdcC